MKAAYPLVQSGPTGGWRKVLVKSGLWLVVMALSILGAGTAAAADSQLLPAAEAQKYVPATVFFRGQVATVQARNSAGIKMADGMLVLSALVDTAGYSTAVQQKYQAYFITEVPLAINGQTLNPGAYGVGFIEGSKFVVMDLGAHDVFTVSGQHDADLKRPTPLQMLADAAPGQYRLYINRNYVVLTPTR
jgi:hypothetical protein